MKLVPLLAIQRGLYNVPIESRFHSYLDTMLQPNRQDIRYPLQNMNPMAKAHVPELLDQYLDLKADEIAKQVVEEVAGHPYADIFASDNLSLGLVLADDALGGWTDRVDVEFKNTFQTQAMLKRGWVEAILWSSDKATAPTVRLPVELAIHRTAYILQHNTCPTTLKEMLDQEACVWKQYHSDTSSSTGRTDLEGLDSAMELLKQNQDACVQGEGYPTIVAAYFGDKAAEARGFPCLGMKQWSGKELCESGLWN